LEELREQKALRYVTRIMNNTYIYKGKRQVMGPVLSGSVNSFRLSAPQGQRDDGEMRKRQVDCRCEQQ
jgi:hypothetical protein